MPDRPLLEETAEFRAILRSATMVAPVGSGRAPRVADLGCLEGGYAVGFARAGYEVLGIEARQANIDACRVAADDLGLDNLEFVKADARSIEQFGRFDLALVLGLLYHLDRPVEFLHTLERCVDRAVLVHTHYANHHNPGNHELGPLTVNEGRRGRWYSELAHSGVPLEEDRWAAAGNERSFWLERRALLQSLRDAGFTSVYEQFDFLSDIEKDDFIEREDRSLFVAVKSARPGDQPTGLGT